MYMYIQIFKSKVFFYICYNIFLFKQYLDIYINFIYERKQLFYYLINFQIYVNINELHNLYIIYLYH